MQKNDNFIINKQQEKENSYLKKRKKIRILISLVTICLIIAIILIIIFATKKSNKEEKEKENVEIDLTYIKSLKYCSHSILELKAINLDKFNNINNTDISFIFTTENSTTKYYSDSLIDNLIKLKYLKKQFQAMFN